MGKRAQTLGRPTVRRGTIRRRVARVALGWQFGYALLPLASIAFVLSIRQPQAWCLGLLLGCLTFFWLCFTHLQPRFFVLAAPIAALLLACVDWGRMRWGLLRWS